MAVMGYSALADLDRAKYNSYIRIKAAALVLHPQFFEQKDTEGSTRQAVFTVWDKMGATPTDTLLTGSYDLTNPDPTTLTEDQVTVTAYERGRVTCSMQGIRATAILSVVDAQQQIVAINMAEGLDNAAGYGIYAALAAHEPVGGPLDWARVLATVRDFADASVPKRDGLYAAVISDFTKHDLFGDPDQLKGFIPVTKYTNPELVYNYELGARYGIRWAVGPSAYHATVESARHDYPIIFGAGCFGQANGYDPEIVVKYGFDTMDRTLYISWKAQRGYSVIIPSYCRQYDVIPNS
jgi:hypothetical protein